MSRDGLEIDYIERVKNATLPKPLIKVSEK